MVHPQHHLIKSVHCRNLVQEVGLVLTLIQDPALLHVQDHILGLEVVLLALVHAHIQDLVQGLVLPQEEDLQEGLLPKRGVQLQNQKFFL